MGADTSIVPPLVYAILGSSREIAIGPVAIISMLLPTMIQKIQDPAADPFAYRNLVFTTTFFAGIFQAAFGLFRSLISSSVSFSFLFFFFVEIKSNNLYGSN